LQDSFDDADSKVFTNLSKKTVGATAAVKQLKATKLRARNLMKLQDCVGGTISGVLLPLKLTTAEKVQHKAKAVEYYIEVNDETIFSLRAENDIMRKALAHMG
jgi:hypothetical protein